MSEASDIEELLGAAMQQRAGRTRMRWVRIVVVAVCSLVGSAVGAAWTARGYIEQLATKSQIETLRKEVVELRNKDVSDQQAKDVAQNDRLLLLETGAKDTHDKVEKDRADLKELWAKLTSIQSAYIVGYSPTGNRYGR